MSMRETPRSAFAHVSPIQTRWSDNDVYGHVNNVTYYSYFDTAVNGWLIDHGALDIHGGDVVGYVVDTSCSYFSPVAFPDRLHVGVRVTKLGRSSVRYELGVYRNDDELPVAAGHFVHVYVDRATGRSAPIPDATRAALETLVHDSGGPGWAGERGSQSTKHKGGTGMTTVGVVGLGTMGAAMARHAIAAGFDLQVHDRDREQEEPLAALGAARAGSPAEAARGADLVLTCVPGDPQLDAAVTSADGIASTIREGAVMVDCSTVSPSIEQHLADVLQERGAFLVDAPVSGGSEGAANGTLTIFCGGTAEAIERARPLLESFSRTITPMGAVGMGQAAKAVNQIYSAGAYACMGEALVYGQKAGLPMDGLVQAMCGGAADSWIVRNRSSNVIDASYPLGFRLWMHLKDIRIGLAEAEKLGVDMPVTQLIADLEQRLVEAGFGDDDVSALARIPRREA